MKKTVQIVMPEVIGHVAPEIYGHFTELIGGVFYDGLWVGRDSPIPNIRGFRKDLVEKLRAIRPAVLRWPGGCFAETYHWRDGIGPNRPVRPSWWTSSDGRYESNAVGTHEFLDLCELVGAKAYLAVNVTSVTPLEAREWMDYCLSPRGSTTLALEREGNGHPEPFRVDYWGIGNENWGGGGYMTPDTYAREYRRFATVLSNLCGAPASNFIIGGANGGDFAWTRGVLENLFADPIPSLGMSFHFYTATSPASRSGCSTRVTAGSRKSRKPLLSKEITPTSSPGRSPRERRASMTPSRMVVLKANTASNGREVPPNAWSVCRYPFSTEKASPTIRLLTAYPFSAALNPLTRSWFGIEAGTPCTARIRR